MANKPSLLARLFGRTQNTVVSKLYSHALSTPLVVHPGIGERLIGAYLDGATDAPQSVAESTGSIAVINISGGMVNRPMPDICGPGPVSYVEIREAMDCALHDENVSAIILRMDTPGGMASGCFDLTDYIYSARGKKPIHAQVDDMAYSGGYSIASACDSIQMTRTGGVGSVGVVTYHIDQSGYDSKVGIKVTYIFAGSKKVDGNPHEALSDTARSDAQKDIDELYDLFVDTVARNRGVESSVIAGTEAGCYGATEALALGLVDSIGTLEDLIARISTPAVPETPEQESNNMTDTTAPAVADGAPAVTAPAVAGQSTETLAAYVAAVSTAGLPAEISMALIKRGPSETAAAVAIANAGKVRDICAAAKLDSCAADYVARGTDVEQVRKEVAAAVADTGKNEVITVPSPSAVDQKKTIDTQAIYANRRNPN